MSLVYKQQHGLHVFCNNAQSVWQTSNTKVNILHDMRYDYEAKAIKQDNGLIIYVGDDKLTNEEAEMDSFKCLPSIAKMADFMLPDRPSDAIVNALHIDLLCMM